MSAERLVNLVLVSIDDDTPEERQSFIQGMSQKFGIPADHLEKIVDSLPFVLSRGCTLDEAREMAGKVQEVGGICRMQDPAEEPAPPPTPEPQAAAPTPSPAPPMAPEPEPEPAVEDSGTIPLATGGSIPLATSGGGGTPAVATGGQVRCIECGEMQPKGDGTCRTCYFPLPEK